jgi:hypothetical protein
VSGRYSTEQREQFDAAAAQLQATLGGDGVEFATAAELIALLSQLPPDTPVTVSRAEREARRTSSTGPDNDRFTFAASVALTEKIDKTDGPDGHATFSARPVPAVELGAFWVGQHQRVPADTIPISPFGRAIEALLGGSVAELSDAVVGWKTVDLKEDIGVSGTAPATASAYPCPAATGRRDQPGAASAGAADVRQGRRRRADPDHLDARRRSAHP